MKNVPNLKWNRRTLKNLVMNFPTAITVEELHKYNNLHWQDAAYAAWRNEGNDPLHHFICQMAVRKLMPLLALALDRGAYGLPLEDSAYGELVGEHSIINSRE